MATTAGDDGVGVTGLDAVRRKTMLRRDETEPARVGRSPAALSGASTASLSTALAADELLGSQRVRERCELRVVKRLARVPEEAVDLGVRRENILARSTSASRRFLFKLSRRASSNAHHATPTRGRVRLAELGSWSGSGVALLLLESLHGPLELRTACMPCRLCTSRQQVSPAR